MRTRPDLLVRPLRLGDAHAVQAFIQGLSVRARVERYFYPLRELTHHAGRCARRLLAHARRQRLASLHGLVRAGNRAMLRLAASLGFRVAPDEDPGLLRVEHPLAHA